MAKTLMMKLNKLPVAFDFLLLSIASLLLHFWRISFPDSIVFDEVTFGKFLNSYAKGEYYFDLHPPLGKLLLSFVSQWGNLNPNFDFNSIGSNYESSTYIWLRSITALAGSLIPIFAMAFLKGLGFSRWVCIVGSFLILIENSFIVISRTFVLDIFLISFGLGALTLYVWSIRKNSKGLWWGAWFLGAAAFSIKWTGLSFLAMISLWEVQQIWAQMNLSTVVRKLIVGWSGALMVYFLIFTLHFSLTPRSGMGDAFMSLDFQSGLIGSRIPASSQRLSLWEQFIELNKTMWSYQKTMNQSHPYSSSWYTWPFLHRPIYFWGKTMGEVKQRIYLMGNPLIWWFSLVAVIILLIKSIENFKPWFKEKIDGVESRKISLLILFLANFLPFMVIGRVMFIYHYLVALIFGIMILALVLESIKYRMISLSILCFCLFTFIFFLPLTYGLGLTDLEYNHRIWFNSWL